MSSQSVNGAVLAGIIVAIVVTVLIVVIIIVPLARRRTSTGAQGKKGDAEQQSGRHSHTRTKSNELPLLQPISPMFGESTNLPPSKDHSSSDHASNEKGSPWRSRGYNTAHSSELQGTPPPAYHSPLDRTPPSLLLSPPAEPVPRCVSAPLQSSKYTDIPSRSKRIARLGLRRSPMETLAEASDISSGDEATRSRIASATANPEPDVQITPTPRPSAMTRFVTQPLTSAFRNSLRSISTQSSASSPSSAVLQHYPSFTASSATYATAAEDLSPSNSRTDVSLRSQTSNLRPVRAPRPGAPPQSDPRSTKRAHLRPSDAVQRPVYHDQLPPHSMARQASINFIESLPPPRAARSSSRG